MRPLLAFAALAVACAPVLPQDPVQRALVRDISRVVEVRDQAGWFADDLELAMVMSDALQSACRTPPAARSASLRWLGEEIEKRGGAVDAVYRANSRDLEHVAELLLLTRTRLLLAQADRLALEGKCPFWIEPDEAFDGRQGFSGRPLLALETGGRAIVGREANQFGFGGGGSGRLLAGYGVSDELTVLGGLELNFGARFTDITLGQRVEVPAVILMGVVPFIARFHQLSSHVEIEGGPMAYLNQVTGRFNAGVRIGGGVGVAYLRLVRGILPGATFTVDYDHVFTPGGEPNIHILSAGIRAAFALSR